MFCSDYSVLFSTSFVAILWSLLFEHDFPPGQYKKLEMEIATVTIINHHHAKIIHIHKELYWQRTGRLAD